MRVEQKGRPVSYILCSLGAMVKKHGAVEGMVIQLFCFHRLLVLHLAACSAIDLRWVTVDVVAKDFCCWVVWGKIPTVSLTCHSKWDRLSKWYICTSLSLNFFFTKYLVKMILFCTTIIKRLVSYRNVKKPLNGRVSTLEKECSTSLDHTRIINELWNTLQSRALWCNKGWPDNLV